MSKFKYTPIFVSGRIIGKVEGKVFYKSIRKKHYLRKPPAIAFDIESLRNAELAGATSVQVSDTDTGKIYYTPIRKIWDIGQRFNRGFGNQIYLCLSDWSSNPLRYVIQPSLFGGVS